MKPEESPEEELERLEDTVEAWKFAHKVAVAHQAIHEVMEMLFGVQMPKATEGGEPPIQPSEERPKEA